MPLRLGYCTNVHPATTLAGVHEQLKRYCAPVAQQAKAGDVGLGLWLARRALRELVSSEEAQATLRGALGEAGLELFTLNAFPFDDFQAEQVKAAVYRPDWTTQMRLEQTLDQARVLAALLPEDEAFGSISTLPLGDARAFRTRDGAYEAAHGQLRKLAEGLRELRDSTGKSIRVCLEPEPECAIETTDAVIQLFEALGDAPEIREHLGVCWDCCHLAVVFEDPAASLARLRDAGIAVGKVQVSSALEVGDPSDPAAREALARFVEPRFLHQVRVQRPDGSVDGSRDLPEALALLPDDGPWRVHFHVPVCESAVEGVQTTQAQLREHLAALVTHAPQCRHYEVETYTWSVLPRTMSGDQRDAALIEGIAQELRWTRTTLEALA